MGYNRMSASRSAKFANCYRSCGENSSLSDITNTQIETLSDFRPALLLSDDIGAELKFAGENSYDGDTNTRDDVEKGNIKHALNIVNHMIVFGCLENLPSFIEYAQTPTQQAYGSQCFVVVSKQPYPYVSLIRKHHSNVFFLQGDIT